MRLTKSYSFDEIISSLKKMFPNKQIEWKFKPQTEVTRGKRKGQRRSWGVFQRGSVALYQIEFWIDENTDGTVDVDLKPTVNYIILLPFGIIPPLIVIIILHLTVFKKQKREFEYKLLDELKKIR